MAGMFGTDGVRARINTGAMTPEAIVRLALASGRWFIDNNPENRTGRPLVVIGKDTRVSGYMVEAALVAGFARLTAVVLVPRHVRVLRGGARVERPDWHALDLGLA